LFLKCSFQHSQVSHKSYSLKTLSGTTKKSCHDICYDFISQKHIFFMSPSFRENHHADCLHFSSLSLQNYDTHSHSISHVCIFHITISDYYCGSSSMFLTLLFCASHKNIDWKNFQIQRHNQNQMTVIWRNIIPLLMR
jgi:hypothetical protein